MHNLTLQTLEGFYVQARNPDCVNLTGKEPEHVNFNSHAFRWAAIGGARGVTGGNGPTQDNSAGNSIKINRK